MSDFNLGDILTHHCFEYFFCSFLFLFTLLFHLAFVMPFVVAPPFLNILFCVLLLLLFFFPLVLFLSAIHFWKFLLTYCKFGDSFFNYAQATNKPTKGTLHFCYSIFFLSLAFLFDSFLELPFLYLHYPSVLIYYLLFH